MSAQEIKQITYSRQMAELGSNPGSLRLQTETFAVSSTQHF